jgi:hypothetical protein
VPAKPQYPLRGSDGGDPFRGSDGGWIFGPPSPHHATRPLASEEISPHLVMQAGEKYSIQHVSKAGRAARIGAIIRKWPAFPAKPDHGAPFLHYGVLFGYEHATFSIANDDVHQRECRPAFLPMRFVTPDKPPPKPVFRAMKVLPALNAPTNAHKNARIGRPFRGNARWLAADVRGRRQHS